MSEEYCMNQKLLIWILQTGEPLPSDDGLHRPMRAINLANALTSAGHNVVLWSASFNHQMKVHRCNGYKSIQYSENLEIRLIPSPGYKKNIGLGRLFDHMVLAKNLKKLLKQEKVEPNAAFIGYPPIEAASIMTHWLKKRNISCLLDIKDQWPSFMVDALPRGFRSIGRAILSPYFYLAKRAMKETTGLSAMADDFLKWALDFSNRERANNDLTVPLTTENCQISDDERKSAIQWWEKQGVVNNGKMKVMFVGSHYPSLDFSPILEAAALFLDKGIECDFIICGHGELTESLVSKAKNYKNVFFPGWVDRPKVEELSKMSIASIAPFRNIDCFMKSLPNKVIDSLSLGLPIISPLKGEVRRLIEMNKVGLIYDEGSGESLFNCIVELGQDEKMCDEITMNSINLYNSRFSYEIVYGGLVKHLENLAMIKDE